MSRRLLILLSVLALAIGVLTPVAAGAADPSADLAGLPKSVEKSPTGSYIVVMTVDPLLASFDQDDLNSRAAQSKAKGLRRGHDKVLGNAGVDADVKVNEYVNAVNGFSAIMSYSDALALAAQPEVALVAPDELRQPTTDNSPSYLGLTDPAGSWQTGYDGEGVLVGVIDTGIWPEHPSFADDGSLPPAPTLDDSRPNCEFGNTSHNADDAPFTCNDKLVGARQMLDTYRSIVGADLREYDSARDDNGHGTHTASTAAGNWGIPASILGSELGNISGMAPRAQIVAYKALGTLGGFTSDLAAAIDQAVADGVDVINYSVGGGASLLGADDIAFLFAADAGVFVATSAGNEGPGAGSIGGPASVPWLTSVGANTQDRTFTSTVTLGDGSAYTGLGIGEADTAPLVDAADLANELCEPSAPFADDITGKIVLCKRGAIPLVDKSQAVYNAGGAGMILYNQAPGMAPYLTTHAVPTDHISYEDGVAVKTYIASEGTAATAMIDGGNRAERAAPWMASFSSRGPDPVAPDIIKPDVTAPGFGILAGYSPTPEHGAAGEFFSVSQGTSMSSPHVAGVFALIKQAHPDWSAAMAKSALMTTARQDVMKEDGSTPANPFDMGAGLIHPGERVHKGSAFQPGLVYDAGFFDYLGFLCDAAPEAFDNPAAMCGYLASVGVPTDASDLNLASIGIADLPGTQTVQRTVTSVARDRGWRRYQVSVDAPPGFEVTVNPSSFKLKAGQSMTYEVTITNVSAPIGEWAFGSLTWEEKTGNYSVYSPIAVNPSLLSAPYEVSGSGETGTASFDVTFGYAGEYTAEPHGLEPAVVTSDNVVQDPDQSFNPNDGYSNLHQFTLADAMFFRIAIPPEATEADADLDVYVFDPNGNFVAASTKGGTDELVDIEEPMDGTWSVFVHGWSTPDGDSDYDMYSWVLPDASGGSLVIDGAPTSATLGATETIDVSWTGATTGDWHLGAVSHADGAGLIGITLIDVDNR